MRDRSDASPASRRAKAPGRDIRKRSDTLGLYAFEKISAVEGISLSAAMREDLTHMQRSGMGERERSRFIIEKYGRE